MDFEVSPVSLRQGAAALDALADRLVHAVVPDRSANHEWAATAANDAAVVAAETTLAGLAGRCRSLADALAAAATAYERADSPW